MPPPTKRRKLENNDKRDVEMKGAEDFGPDRSSDEDEWVSEDEDLSVASSSLDTDTEIALAKVAKKSKKTAKRKLRATSPSRFGQTLEALLNTSAPAEVPLALKPSIGRKKNEHKHDIRARKVVEMEKKELEEIGRVRDAIGGWGGENERDLRKVAQRGGELFHIECRECSIHRRIPVVQLFNMIQKAQTASGNAEAAKVALRGSGKPTLPAPDFNSKSKTKGKKDNAIGRAKEGLCAAILDTMQSTDICLSIQVMSRRKPSWTQSVRAE